MVVYFQSQNELRHLFYLGSKIFALKLLLSVWKTKSAQDHKALCNPCVQIYKLST